MAVYREIIDRSHDEDKYRVLDPPVETGEVFVEPELVCDVPDECPMCGYDLRGNPESVRCPECGVDIAEAEKLLEAKAIRRAEILSGFGLFWWVVLGIIPILLWVPAAFFMYRSNSNLLMMLTLPFGLVTAMGSVMFASTRAGEEAQRDEMGAVFVVCFVLCMSHLFVLLVTYRVLLNW